MREKERDEVLLHHHREKTVPTLSLHREVPPATFISAQWFRPWVVSLEKLLQSWAASWRVSGGLGPGQQEVTVQLTVSVYKGEIMPDITMS